MATIDDQVKGWLREKFLSADILWGRAYDPALHGSPEEVEVLKVDTGWDCGCYSSWTRDDSFRVTARMKARNGEFDWSYGVWADIPDFIKELDEYINGNGCYYESDEYAEQFKTD